MLLGCVICIKELFNVICQVDYEDFISNAVPL